MRFLRLTGWIRVVGVDQKVNRCWLKYQILKSIVSALSGYFYGSQNPSGRSEISYIRKKVEKGLNPCQPVPLVSILRDIAQKPKQGPGSRNIYWFFGDFLVYKGFLSDQMSSGSHKNSQRELRWCFSRSDILVNTCWPFGQHMYLKIGPQVKKLWQFVVRLCAHWISKDMVILVILP